MATREAPANGVNAIHAFAYTSIRTQFRKDRRCSDGAKVPYSMPPPVKQMHLTGEIEGQKTQTSKRYLTVAEIRTCILNVEMTLTAGMATGEATEPVFEDVRAALVADSSR